MEGRLNLRNPAIKRILQETKEFHKEDGSEMLAVALEDNVFEWHFAIRGPPDTEFEGGIYHGRILLPPEYPFKPPSFLMLTPNGRFETGVKICLSISSHHPEHWQPSWSVRTALTALIAFMPTPGGGAIGSLDYTKEERRELARKSRAEPPTFGSAARQAITQEVHQRMLDCEVSMKKRDAVAEGTVAEQPAVQSTTEEPTGSDQTPEAPVTTAKAQPGAPVSTNCVQPAAMPAAGPSTTSPAVTSAVPAHKSPLIQGLLDGKQDAVLLAQELPAVAEPAAPAPQSWEDMALTCLAGAICFLIALLLLRKAVVASGADITSAL